MPGGARSRTCTPARPRSFVISSAAASTCGDRSFGLSHLLDVIILPLPCAGAICWQSERQISPSLFRPCLRTSRTERQEAATTPT